MRVWFAPARPSHTRLRSSLSAGDLHRPLLRVHPVYTHATKILTLHAKNAAKVTSVTLSRAYFMAGPHTQPPASIIPLRNGLARVDDGLLHFAEGSSPVEKTLPDTGGAAAMV